jgi:hypothetical protein
MGQTVHLFEADEICHYVNTLTHNPGLHIPHMPPSFFLATMSQIIWSEHWRLIFDCEPISADRCQGRPQREYNLFHPM